MGVKDGSKGGEAEVGHWRDWTKRAHEGPREGGEERREEGRRVELDVPSRATSFLRPHSARSALTSQHCFSLVYTSRAE